MDMGVMLVQAYLRVHGYFTVSEYPILQTGRRGEPRVATDIDILAFRFPHACTVIAGQRHHDEDDRALVTPDPALGASPDRVDMIIGEVKVGAAELNRAATDPAVLRAALMRFGCCSADHATAVVETLLRDGRAVNHVGHDVRLIAFGSAKPTRFTRASHVILLGDIILFLRRYLRAHWDVLHHADFKDPAFSLLMMLEKAGAGAAARPNSPASVPPPHH